MLLFLKKTWKKYSDHLELKDIEIDIAKEDTKKIWDKLSIYLPTYSLFQADRKNSDNDNEVQDPLKEAVKQIIKDEDLQATLTQIANTVRNKVEEVASRTLEKIREMDPEIAKSLNPIIPSSTDLKWQDVFKNVSICGDDNIPMNKRGSGVRRLILLNFFRAEAERRVENHANTTIIYAIEEPETSQHTKNQYKLINTFKELSKLDKTQILLTTHSAHIVKNLSFEDIRLLTDYDNKKYIENISSKQLNYLSLNEVNYLAFEEASEEYHNELYGYIERNEWLKDYKSSRYLPHQLMEYIQENKNGSLTKKNICLTEYIRHQIHQIGRASCRERVSSPV